jgi:hypothetical protein
MGTNPKVCFLGGHGREKFGYFSRQEGGIFFFKELFFWWCGMGCLEKADGALFFGLL